MHIYFFDKIGITNDEIFELKVPGSFELIYACSKVQSFEKYDAILAIGSIIEVKLLTSNIFHNQFLMVLRT